jgi:hypothetical protein
MDLTQWIDQVALSLSSANPSTADLILALVVCVGIVLLASWIAGRAQMLKRSRLFLVNLDDSTAAHTELDRPASAGGFATTLLPAPEPYDFCFVRYRTRAEFNPLAWLLQLIAPAPELLEIRAMLPAPPGSELVWIRGQLPATALGLHPSRDLWTLHRLDIVDAEYATRGDATNAVQHAFGELQNRFGPFLNHIVVRADVAYTRTTQAELVDGTVEPHITVSLSTARLDPGQTQILMALVRSLGRAAQID